MKSNMKFFVMAIFMFVMCLTLTSMFGQMNLQLPLFSTVSLMISAAIADYMTTMKALKLGGREGNPIAAWMFRRFGAKRGGMAMMLILIPMMCMFVHAPVAQQLALGFVYWMIPMNNLRVIRRLQKARQRMV